MDNGCGVDAPRVIGSLQSARHLSTQSRGMRFSSVSRSARNRWLSRPAPSLSALRIAYLRAMRLAACRHIKTAALHLRDLSKRRPGSLSSGCHGETGRGRIRDSPANKVGTTEP